MKVILIQDVAKIGRRFSVVDVPHGYAMNKLIPQGLAKEATPENVKQVKARGEKLAQENAAQDASFKDSLAKLADKTVQITIEANDSGHLFQAVKSDRIAEAFAAEGMPVPKDAIIIDAPIKSVGEHTVTLRHGEQEGSVTINIVTA